MSKSYSPASAPEFLAQYDYSDILGTAAPDSTAPIIKVEDLQTPSITSEDLALQYYGRGSQSLALKDYAQARSAYKIALEWNPKLAIAYSGIAQICYEVKDYAGAIIAGDLAIKLDGTQVDFYYQRALVNKVIKNYNQVLIDCQQILAQDPNHPSASWLKAVALVKTENYQIALPLLDLHIQAYPEDSNGYCYRGICYERLENFPQALADFDRAIELQPNHPTFHHARGRTRQKSGDLTGALADFNLTIEGKPQAIVYDERAEIHRCLGNQLEALQDCDHAIALNSQFFSAYFRRGLTYAELGDIDLALIDYTSTIDLNPEHIDAYIQRSWIYFRREDYQLAQQDCVAVQSFSSTSFWASYILGLINNLAGLKQEAIDHFSSAIEISANYVSTRYHRGIIYYELGDIPNAMADFDHARSIQSQRLERLIDRDETGFYAEGLALQYLGESAAARKILRLGALAAKRFNNPHFHQLILSNIAEIDANSADLKENSPI